MAIPVRDEHRPVGDDRVEALLAGGAARKGVHRPTASRDPLSLGMLGRIPRDRVEALLRSLGLVEVALDRQETSVRRVQVGVLEARENGAALQFDHPRRRPCRGCEVRCGANGRNAAALDRDPLRRFRSTPCARRRL
jgi:hypothetical protein